MIINEIAIQINDTAIQIDEININQRNSNTNRWNSNTVNEIAINIDKKQYKFDHVTVCLQGRASSSPRWLQKPSGSYKLQ